MTTTLNSQQVANQLNSVGYTVFNALVVGNTYYYLVNSNNRIPINDSNAARSFGGDLVSISSATENSYVYSLISNYGNAYIGLSDIYYGEGNYFWLDGSSVSYTNWAFGEPNDGNGNIIGGEDFVEMIAYYAPGQWNDIYSGATPYSVLEFTFNNPNSQPIAYNQNLGQSLEADQFNTVNGILTGYDADGQSLTYTLVNNVTVTTNATNYFGQTLQLDTPQVSLQPNGSFTSTGNFNALAAGQIAQVAFQFRVTDTSNAANATSAPATVTYNVIGTNDAPYILTPIQNGSVTEDFGSVPSTILAINEVLDASDADGSSLRGINYYYGTQHSADDYPLNGLISGQSYTITMYGLDASGSRNGSDTYLYLYTYDSNGIRQIVTFNDDSIGLTARITFTPQAGVQYYVQATEYNPGSVENYFLEVVSVQSDQLITTGNISFADVDFSDTHSVNVLQLESNTTTLGNFSASVNQSSKTVNWNFNVNNSAINYLAAGQQIIQSYSVVISDGHGGSASQVVSITINGTNDVPVVSGAVLGTATEDAITSTVNALANASDVDVGTILQVTDIQSNLPAGVTFNANNKTFSLDPTNEAYQSLAANQTTTVTVSYKVFDGFVKVNASVQWTVTGYKRWHQLFQVLY